MIKTTLNRKPISLKPANLTWQKPFRKKDEM